MYVRAGSARSGGALTASKAITEQTCKLRFYESSYAGRIVQDIRTQFIHGTKGPVYQRYIVLHDTEGTGSPDSVIDYWASTGTRVAAHFIIGRDGSIYQCVPMDSIAHHAGYGSTGQNQRFGVTDESRDDKVGTARPSPGYSDYGMNSYSIGIELVHAGGGYPTAQLEALDWLIAYIDGYYGSRSTIIDHKTWAVGNSDTSPEFAGYLRNYQSHRSYR
jgi:N-acetyl-anhydromuramyl-L-alanine amidase AmpD